MEEVEACDQQVHASARTPPQALLFRAAAGRAASCQTRLRDLDGSVSVVPAELAKEQVHFKKHPIFTRTLFFSHRSPPSTVVKHFFRNSVR